MTRKDIDNYKNLIKEIGIKCKEYFELNKPFPSAQYSHWEFSGDNHVKIHYLYNEYYYSANDMIAEKDSCYLFGKDSWEIHIDKLLDEE